MERPTQYVTSQELLDRVYMQLRTQASARLRHEKPGQTLSATALVHEAWLRIQSDATDQVWDSEAHFYSAASQAMRRILIDNARRKNSLKHGGNLARQSLQDPAAEHQPARLLEIDEALSKFELSHPDKAELVKLRYFGGCTHKDAARLLGISVSTAERYWAYAKAFLQAEIDDSEPHQES